MQRKNMESVGHKSGRLEAPPPAAAAADDDDEGNKVSARQLEKRDETNLHYTMLIYARILLEYAGPYYTTIQQNEQINK